MALSSKEDFLAQLKLDPALAQHQEECPICYELTTDATQTFCGHVFCLKCLQPWLRTSHTCPKCRRELYEKPEDEEDEDEEDEDELDRPTVDFDWPEFDFDFHEARVREMLQSHLDDSFLDAEPTCSLRALVAYVDYDTLLTTAVAYILNRVRDDRNRDLGIDGPVYLQSWGEVATAIETVLASLRNRKIEGHLLFLALEYESQERLRLPENSALRERRRTDPAYSLFELSINGVLQRVVKSGYDANPDQQTYDQQNLPRTWPDYSRFPFCVDPQDLFVACPQLPTVDTPFRKSIRGRPVYVSRLLAPTCLASIHRLKITQGVRFYGDDSKDLHDLYDRMLPELPKILCTALDGFHGETMAVNDLIFLLLKFIARLSSEFLTLSQSQEEVVVMTQRMRVIEHFLLQIRSILVPVVLVAVDLYNDLLSLSDLLHNNEDATNDIN